MTAGLEPFRPAIGLANPHMQSAMRSTGLVRSLVRRRCAELVEREERWVMDGGDGVRLQGFFTRATAGSRGLAVLLHGWEGSSESTYMLSTGTRLLGEGFDVFRLNFRDHGDSHSLNPGIFHSCRLDEVLNALLDLQQRTGAQNWQIAGFSLGGNFALRSALYAPRKGLEMGQCVAVCPVIDPDHVLKSMENGPTFYERYYNEKWAESLRKKESHFPGRYEYDEFHRHGRMRERTRYLATRYYGFDCLEDYFNGYSIAGEVLRPLKIRSRILTAADDPVTPVADIELLPDNPCLDIVITDRGGHCGYLKNWKMESWAEDFVVHHFTRKTN